MEKTLLKKRFLRFCEEDNAQNRFAIAGRLLIDADYIEKFAVISKIGYVSYSDLLQKVEKLCDCKIVENYKDKNLLTPDFEVIF